MTDFKAAVEALPYVSDDPAQVTTFLTEVRNGREQLAQVADFLADGRTALQWSWTGTGSEGADAEVGRLVASCQQILYRLDDALIAGDAYELLILDVRSAIDELRLEWEPIRISANDLLAANAAFGALNTEAERQSAQANFDVLQDQLGEINRLWRYQSGIADQAVATMTAALERAMDGTHGAPAAGTNLTLSQSVGVDQLVFDDAVAARYRSDPAGYWYLLSPAEQAYYTSEGERALATEAAKAAVFEGMGMPYDPAAGVANAWDSLSPMAQEALLRSDPAKYSTLAGIPPAAQSVALELLEAAGPLPIPPAPAPPYIDSGAGEWNSQPWYAVGDDLVFQGGVSVAVGAADAVGLTHAAGNLNHYLMNSGETRTISPDELFRDVPTVQKSADILVAKTVSEAVSAAVESGNYGTQIPIQSGWDGVSVLPSESKDWFLAVGSYQQSVTGVVTVLPPTTPGGEPTVSVQYQVHVYDRYNWDGGKSTEIAGITIDDQDMGELHTAGLAQEYDIVGSSSVYTYQGVTPSLDDPAFPSAPENRDGTRTDPGR